MFPRGYETGHVGLIMEANMIEKIIRIALIFSGVTLTVFGFHSVANPILFLIGLGVLTVIGEDVIFEDDVFRPS